MSNLIMKRKSISLAVILTICAITFASVFTVSAQTVVGLPRTTDDSTQTVDENTIDDEDATDEDTTDSTQTTAEVAQTTDDTQTTVSEDDIDEDADDEGDGFNLPPSFPADWTIEDIIEHLADLEKNKTKKLFLKKDGEPRFIGVAANNGFSRGHEGLITEDEMRNKKAPLISAPEFTVRVKTKKIKYALTKKKSCEEVTYRSKILKVGDLKEDGIFYICVRATKGKRVWEILSPLMIVRNTTVKGYASVESDSVDCREVSEEKWLPMLEASSNDGVQYVCMREKETIKHDKGVVGIGGTRHDLWKFATDDTPQHIKAWEERETKDYIWPVH